MTKNIFLETVKTSVNLSEYIDIVKNQSKFFSTEFLNKKVELLKSLNLKNVSTNLLHFLEKNKDKIESPEKEKNLIMFLYEIKGEYHNISLDFDLLLSLDKERYNKVMETIKNSKSSYNHIYIKTNDGNFYVDMFEPVIQAMIYHLTHETFKDMSYKKLFPDKNFKHLSHSFLFKYYENINSLISQYADNVEDFTLVDSTEDSFKTKINKFLEKLKSINVTFESLGHIMDLFVKEEIPFEKCLKILDNMYFYQDSKLSNILEFGIKYIPNFEFEKEDYLFINNLLKVMDEKSIDYKTLSKERMQNIILYLKDNKLYNSSIISQVIHLSTSEDEININLSDVAKKYNNIVDTLSKNSNIFYKMNTVLDNLSLLNVKKSKTFLHLLEENMDKVLSVLKDNLSLPTLFSKVFLENVHVNMVTEKTLEQLLSSSENARVTKTLNQLKTENTVLFKEKLTPELFIELTNEFKVLLANILLEKNIKKDMIIRILKSFDNVKKGATMITHNTYIEVIKNMSEKELNQLYQFRKDYSKVLDRDTVFMVHLLKQKFPIFNQVTVNEELEFLLSNDDNLGDDMKTMLEGILDSRQEYKQFKKSLEASETFFNENKINLINFFTKGLHRIVLDYVSGSKEKEVKNAYLLAKAEIANRLYDVKFQNVENELELNLSDEFKANWTTLLSKEKNFLVKEVVDFKTLFELGENPSRSCMNYKTGQYRQCLLSIFDSTKQYIGIYDKGKLVGRAILRLTKTTEKINNKKLGFVDVEDLDKLENNSKIVTKEEPILFLERLYSSYTGDKRIQIMNEVIELVKEKAKNLNIEFIASGDYAYADDVSQKDIVKNIFITHSQNGNQYLDSFGGSHSENAGGIYKSIRGYVN